MNSQALENSHGTEGEWLTGDTWSGWVSVIVPIYNRQWCLIETLDSIQKQTFRPIEVILIDDGSTDNSVSIAKRWAEESYADDFQVRVIEQENQGVDTSRDTGVKASHGEFIQFLDSDDLLHRDKLRLCLDLFTTPEIDTVVCRHTPFKTFDEIQDRLESESEKQLNVMDPERLPFFTRMGWEIWSPVYRRELVNRVGPMKEGLDSVGTYYYTTILKLHSNTRRYVNRKLVFYRLGHSDAMTNTKLEINIREKSKLLVDMMDDLDRFQITEISEWKHMATLAFRTFHASRRIGDPVLTKELLSSCRRAAWRWSVPFALVMQIPSSILSTALSVASSLQALVRKPFTKTK